jgi:hypothetical protein
MLMWRQHGGIYTRRWGDAPIRTLAASMLSLTIRHFDELVYYHQSPLPPRLIYAYLKALPIATILALLGLYRYGLPHGRVTRWLAVASGVGHLLLVPWWIALIRGLILYKS